VKRGVGFLGFDGFAETLLFLEDGVEVLVVSVVAAALDVAHEVDGCWVLGKFIMVDKANDDCII
jgi:hypothetical protein